MKININKLKQIYNSKYFPRLLYVKPDGGKNSGVTGYFLIEWKILFSIGILRFNKGSREALHTHAFNAITFWLWGEVKEEHLDGDVKDFKGLSLIPKLTKRSCYHRIISKDTSWALTFRGNWKDIWCENRQGKEVKLTHGRIIVEKNNV
tara:strand:+ start:42 stop:488 length:447 start_codon:yes stop_codon:yes gene_type:complete